MEQKELTLLIGVFIYIILQLIVLYEQNKNNLEK